VLLGAETLLERAVRVALEAGFKPVFVVVRTESEVSAPLHEPDCEILVNAQAAEGMASSIRCGVEAAQRLGVLGLVVMECDQVGVRPEHLRALVVEPERVTGSRYAGKVGVPAYFPASCFGALMELRGDVGARSMLRGAEAVEDEMLALDVDTEEDVERARAYLGVESRE
jgi:CTP:molybdopterin cytidylyltransferase MocA